MPFAEIVPDGSRFRCGSVPFRADCSKGSLRLGDCPGSCSGSGSKRVDNFIKKWYNNIIFRFLLDKGMYIMYNFDRQTDRQTDR